MAWEKNRRIQLSPGVLPYSTLRTSTTENGAIDEKFILGIVIKVST